MTNFILEFPFDTETRKLTIGPAILMPPDHVNLFLSRPRIEGEEILRTVEVGVNLSPEQQRELAHELLRRLGDPVPEPPAKEPEAGDFYRARESGTLYRLTQRGHGPYWEAEYRRTDGSFGFCEIKPQREPYEPVKVEVTPPTVEAWTVVE